ncbi:glucan biosynthesis protein [Faunimonas sp. B44]|uniref:glucan biosynthesis protein n=1 Tax=Faunimonas sp. B44 TaxID=3461493 RepID=UPI004044181D
MLAALAALPASKVWAEENARVPGGGSLRFGKATRFSWEWLIARAREMRDTPYEPRRDPAPEILAQIGYEQHHAIHQPASGGIFAAPGRDGIVTAFHLSDLFREPVRLNKLQDGLAYPLLYRNDYFSHPAGSPASDMPDDAGFAGFRVHERWNGTGQPGDWLAFLGASYFRSSGDLRQYGISARALALDTAAADGRAEEFPAFTEFWIEEMKGGVMMIYALLDGPSVTAAFRFEVQHLPNVVMDTSCRIFLRRDVSRFGVAPLTSMYWYSQEKRWTGGDWRPEVHDSDGLLLMGGDEAIWRPLTNPGEVSVSSFPLPSGGGFGLMQRDRNYANYQDKVAFERRPNLWVEPISGFEAGEVQLIEFPTEAEYGDNIVAFYVPERPAEAGSDFAFRYRLHWSGVEPPSSLAKLTDLRLGLPRLNERKDGVRLERKVITDFAGGALAGLDPAKADISIEVTGASTFKPGLSRSPMGPAQWRLSFDIFSTDPAPVDLSITLTQDGRALTETALIRVWPD